VKEATVKRLLRDLDDARDALADETTGLLAARRRLRDLENDGYGSGGANEASIGGGRHSDPVQRSVLRREIILRDDAGNEIGRRWVTRDEFEAQRHHLERELGALVDHAQQLAEECTLILKLPEADANAGEPACRLCEAARYVVDAHKCSEECAARDHMHPDRRQPVYARTAPRTPVRVHACTPPRLAVLVDGSHELGIPFARVDVAYVVAERPLAGGDRQLLLLHGDSAPAGTRALARLAVPAEAGVVFEADIVALPAVGDAPRCSWHYEFAERYGVDAAGELTLWHLEHPGQRVPNTLVRDHHPAEFERHQSR